MKRVGSLVLCLCVIGCVEQPSLVNAQLSGTVKIRGIELLVVNEESFPWKDVTVVLNDVYTVVLPTVEADHTHTVSLREFVDRTGHRFSPIDLKPLRVNVRATRAGIAGTLSGEFVDTK